MIDLRRHGQPGGSAGGSLNSYDSPTGATSRTTPAGPPSGSTRDA